MNGKEFIQLIQKEGFERNEAIEFVDGLREAKKINSIQCYVLMVEIFKTFDY